MRFLQRLFAYRAVHVAVILGLVIAAMVRGWVMGSLFRAPNQFEIVTTSVCAVYAVLLYLTGWRFDFGYFIPNRDDVVAGDDRFDGSYHFFFVIESPDYVAQRNARLKAELEASDAASG